MIRNIDATFALSTTRLVTVGVVVVVVCVVDAFAP